MSLKRLLATTAVFSLFALFTFGFADESRIVSTVQNENTLSILIDIHDPGLSEVVIDGRTFDKVDISSDGYFGTAGTPAVPSWCKWVRVPDGMSAQVQVISSGEKVTRNVLLSPFASADDNPMTAEAPSMLDDAYNANLWIPESNAQVSDPIQIGSSRFVIVDMSPYRYNPALKELREAQNFEVQLTFIPDPTSTGQQIRTHEFAAFQELESALNGSPRRDRNTLRTDLLGHIVIIVSANNNIRNLEAIRDLAEWKRRKGYMVTIASLADIGNRNDQLKGWLQEAYDEWPVPPTHVLLMGDTVGDATIPYFNDGVGDSQSWSTSDHQYVQWVGENELDLWMPEGFVGRLPAANANELRRLINKILIYERDPFTDQPWVEGAVLMGNGVRSCIHVNIAIREIMVKSGFNFNDIHEAYANWHLNQYLNRPPINNAINDGVGFVNFRGYNDWGGYFSNQNEITQYSNGRKLPILTGMVCGTSDFPNRHTAPQCISESYLRGRNDDTPHGAVAALGPTDLYTHTWFNNVLDAEFYDVLFNKDVNTMGVAALAGKLAVYNAFPTDRRLGNGYTTGYYFYTYVILGDPSLQVWTKDPYEITVDFDDNIATGSTQFEVMVSDDDDVAVPNAYIHVFKMNDDEEFHLGAYTDEDGIAEFNVDPMVAGEYMLTVTGRNMVPVLETLTVADASVFSTIDNFRINDDSNGDSDGNDNGMPNPGETIELYLSVRNTGTNICAASTASLAAESPYVEIVRGQVQFGEVERNGSVENQQPFVVRILPGAQDEAILPFNVNFSAGDLRWHNQFETSVVGYRFRITEMDFSGELTPGSTRELSVIVENDGELDANPLTAILDCRDPHVQIRIAESFVGEVEAGDEGVMADPFELFIAPDAFHGSDVNFSLILQDEEGRCDTLIIPTTLGTPGVQSPQGPDNYGYWAIDTRDVSTNMAPEYNWIDGTTNLQMNDPQIADNDQVSDHGVLRRVQLPFTFKYYGQEYDEITVGSNGWICFGETDQIAWQNLDIFSPISPGGMLAPYWEDLHNGQNSGVFTRFIENDAIFVIEWRNFGSIDFNQLRFEIQLFDPTVYRSATGDGEFQFVYRSIPEPRRDLTGEAKTIGISSPDRHDGLQITYAQAWDVRTSRLENEMAIRFTTGEFTEVGSIEGRILDATDNQPMAGVRVMLDNTGFFANTDVEGNYRIDRIPQGQYRLLARKLHFNDGIRADVQVEADRTANVNLSLTHPVFNIDMDRIDIGLEKDSVGSREFTISNTGNGPLSYKAFMTRQEAQYERWDVIFDIHGSDSVETDSTQADNRLQGLAYDDEFVYIAGPGRSQELPYNIYVFDKNGMFVRQFAQYTYDSLRNNYGYSDLSLKGDNLLAIDKTYILEITKEGELVDVIDPPINPIALIWVEARQTIFIKDITGDNFYEIDLEGNTVATYNLGERIDDRCYALTWFEEDPDGYPLYIFNDDQAAADTARCQLVKMNPETGQFLTVGNIALGQDCANARPEGLVITKTWDPLEWMVIGLLNNGSDDRIFGFEYEHNYTWVTIDPDVAEIAPDSRITISTTFSAEELPEGDYALILNIEHNAVGDLFEIPIHYNIGPQLVDTDNTGVPAEFSFSTPYPNPFNPTTQFKFTLTKSSAVDVTVWDVNGRLVDRMDLGNKVTGYHTIRYNGDRLAGGLYFVRLTAGSHTAVQKMVLLK